MNELVGYSGMALVLLSFALSRGHYPKSQAVNVIANVLLGAYAMSIGALPYLTLNSIAGSISAYNLLKVRKERKR